MKTIRLHNSSRSLATVIAIAILTAGMSLGAFATPAAQHDQSNNNVAAQQDNGQPSQQNQSPQSNQPSSDQQDPYQPGPPPQQNAQPYPGQPYPGQQSPGQYPRQYGNGQPGARPPQYRQGPAPVRPPAGPAPAALNMQAGTLISVRTTQWLSSDRNVAGDSFTATLDQPLVVDGWVVARKGQTVMGQVAVAKKAGFVKGQSQLGLQLNDLSLVDGQQLPIQTQLIQSSGGTSNGRDAAAVGATTITGAAIGGIADGGAGAGIGAGAGAAAGIIGVLSTRGRATMIPPEALLTFRVDAPISISTEHSQMAFQPVGQADYAGDQDAYGPDDSYPPQRVATPGYPPPAFGYPYPYPYYYSPYGYGYGYGYYPGPFIGVYGRFGYGGYYGRGFRRR